MHKPKAKTPNRVFKADIPKKQKAIMESKRGGIKAIWDPSTGKIHFNDINSAEGVDS